MNSMKKSMKKKSETLNFDNFVISKGSKVKMFEKIYSCFRRMTDIHEITLYSLIHFLDVFCCYFTKRFRFYSYSNKLPSDDSK